MIMIACLSIFVIATLKSSSENFNICVITLLVSLDCLLPYKYKFSRFFIGWVILDYTQDILNNAMRFWTLLKATCLVILRILVFFSICLLIFQRPRVAVPCILLRFYSCIQRQTKVALSWLHFIWEQTSKFGVWKYTFVT